MSEDRTGETNSGRSFEERVFIRFDAIDTRLGRVEGRLEVLEAKSYDTKPIWERALAEIASLRDEMNERFDKVDQRFTKVDARFDEVDQRFDKVDQRFIKVDARFDEVDERFDKFDDRFRSLDGKFDVLAGDMIQLRTDQRRVECRMDKIETR